MFFSFFSNTETHFQRCIFTGENAFSRLRHPSSVVVIYVEKNLYVTILFLTSRSFNRTSRLPRPRISVDPSFRRINEGVHSRRMLVVCTRCIAIERSATSFTTVGRTSARSRKFFVVERATNFHAYVFNRSRVLHAVRAFARESSSRQAGRAMLLHARARKLSSPAPFLIVFVYIFLGRARADHRNVVRDIPLRCALYPFTTARTHIYTYIHTYTHTHAC